MDGGITIRSIREDEFRAFLEVVVTAFGGHLTDDELKEEREVAEPERSLAALEGDRMVGTAGAFSLRMTVPGGTVPVAGVTGVGVLPSHRRRGLLRSLMRRQLDDVHERGEALAALWASEGSIYGRFGYGLAALGASFEIERGRSGFATPPPAAAEGRVGLVERKTALERMPPVYARLVPGTAGMMARSGAWWPYSFTESEHHRDGASELFFAVHESPEGADDGYVAYRIKGGWGPGGPDGTVIVWELMAETPGAYAAIWRYLLDMDLTARVRGWNRPVDEPLLHLLSEPRRLGLRMADALWLRLVDVREALATRSYSLPGRLTLRVRDSFCPWNDGTYLLESGPGGARCELGVSGDPDLELGAADLAATYLGGVTFDALARAGRVAGRRPGAVERADAMFRTQRPPWCALHF